MRLVRWQRVSFPILPVVCSALVSVVHSTQTPMPDLPAPWWLGTGSKHYCQVIDESVGFLPACRFPVLGDLFPFVLGHIRVSKAAASILSIIEVCHKNTRGFPKPQNEGFYNINSTLVNLIQGYLLHQNLFTVMYYLVTGVITAVS